MTKTITKMVRLNISKILVTLILTCISVVNVNGQLPPLFSMEKVNNNMHIDATEVNVGSWLSYYNWVLIHEGYINAQKVLPDSTKAEATVWEYFNQKSGDYIETPARYTNKPIGYFKKLTDKRYILDKGDLSNGFDIYNLPITGVSYEQVRRFCQWRTKANGKGKYVFRLPTEKEWVDYCRSHAQSCHKSINMTDSIAQEGFCTIYNYCHVNCENNETVSQLFHTASFFCDNNNVFDMYGNVSEMTFEKGKAKGGNYTLFASRCHTDSVQYYTQPEKWLGFRCIAEKINDENKERLLNSNVYQTPEITEADTINNKHGVFFDTRDGNLYPTVKIGGNIWFAKNLAYKPAEGKYWEYKNKEETIKEQGYLYTWEVAKDVCPQGWELPTKDDFMQLIDLFGDSAYVELRPNGSSGFCMFNCGVRTSGSFKDVRGYTSYWLLDRFKNNFFWGISLNEHTSSIHFPHYFNRRDALPVRCVKKP